MRTQHDIDNEVMMRILRTFINRKELQKEFSEFAVTFLLDEVHASKEFVSEFLDRMKAQALKENPNRVR